MEEKADGGTCGNMGTETSGGPDGRFEHEKTRLAAVPFTVNIL